MGKFANNIIASIILSYSAFPAEAGDFDKWKNKIENDTINPALIETLYIPSTLERTREIVPAKKITDAALRYFDEEVKLYKLKPKTRVEIQGILMKYLSTHPLLVKNNNWNILFVIDDKKAFSNMVSDITHCLLNWMPSLVRKIAVNWVFWWEEKLQNKLDNLNQTVRNMKYKQYEDVVLDYVWWIIKRSISDKDWKITTKEYCEEVMKYFPNKNSDKLLKDLEQSNQSWNSLVHLKYPF